jgi:hypothetical protein
MFKGERETGSHLEFCFAIAGDDTPDVHRVSLFGALSSMGNDNDACVYSIHSELSRCLLQSHRNPWGLCQDWLRIRLGTMLRGVEDILNLSFLPTWLLQVIPIRLQSERNSSDRTTLEPPSLMVARSGEIHRATWDTITGVWMCETHNAYTKAYPLEKGIVAADRIRLLYDVVERISKEAKPVTASIGIPEFRVKEPRANCLIVEAQRVDNAQVFGAAPNDLRRGLAAVRSLAQAMSTVSLTGSEEQVLSIRAYYESLYVGSHISMAKKALVVSKLVEPIERMTDLELCHGDVWTDNLLTASDRTIVLDFDNMVRLPRHYDPFYYAFFAISRSAPTSFRRWLFPVDPSREVAQMGRGSGWAMASQLVRVFREFKTAHNMDNQTVNSLEAVYWRHRAIYWAANPAWHPRFEIAITNLGDYADSLESGSLQGVMNHLTAVSETDEN